MRWIAICLALAASASLAAQDTSKPAGQRLAFDVVSIKRTEPGTGGGRIGNRPGGTWETVNMPIAGLIRTAYPADVTELGNAPAWVESERYNVTAKPPMANPTIEQTSEMMQVLLAERVKFAGHYETRERPVYLLVVARRDGRLGPQISKSTLDCEAINAARREGRAVDLPAPANGGPPCGLSMIGDKIIANGWLLSWLVRSFGEPDGRVILDRTELTGGYDLTLEYSMLPTGDKPSLVTALEEQLGLKLVPDKAPLKVFVIDHIERPTEN